MSIKFKGQIVSGGGGGGAVSSVNSQTGAVNIYADDTTLNIDGAALTLTGTGATSTLNVDVGTAANKIVQLDGTAKLPAVDGSQLTNLPSAPVSSVNSATGAVNIYADDSTLNIDGTALTLTGTGATSTLNVDVGTAANKIVQLDGSAKLPAVDGSALTNLPSAPVSSVNTATGAVVLDTDDIAEGANLYFTTGRVDTQVATLPMSTLSDVAYTAGAGIDNYVLTYDHSSTSWGAEASAGGGAVSSVNGATGAVNIYADDSTLNIDGTALVLSGTAATSTLNVDVGTTANKIVQLDGTAKLPAVDGSNLTNLPSALVSSVNGATGAVNIYADDSTLNIDGTALTLTGTGATSTLNVDVGTAANKIVQLDGSAKLPAVDGSALTNLPSAPVTSVNTATGAVVLDTDDIAEAANLYFTTGRVDTQVATLPMSTLSDVAYTAGAGIDNYVLTYDHSSTSWGAEASAGGGGARPTVTAITATPYTIGTTDSAIGASELERTYVCSSSAATVNLPTAVGLNGFKLQIKSLLATTVTIDPDGTEHIDHAGQTTFSIATQYTSITLQSDNANWIIV